MMLGRRKANHNFFVFFLQATGLNHPILSSFLNSPGVEEELPVSWHNPAPAYRLPQEARKRQKVRKITPTDAPPIEERLNTRRG